MEEIKNVLEELRAKYAAEEATVLFVSEEHFPGVRTSDSTSKADFYFDFVHKFVRGDLGWVEDGRVKEQSEGNEE